MISIITGEQALALSFTPFKFRSTKTDKRGRTIRDDAGEAVFEILETKRFIKPGEAQDKAVKRLMRSGLTKNKPRSSWFPNFIPGRTTTAAYVREFETMNKLLKTGSAIHLSHPAPVNEGPEVIFSTVGDECLDLI